MIAMRGSGRVAFVRLTGFLPGALAATALRLCPPRVSLAIALSCCENHVFNRLARTELQEMARVPVAEGVFTWPSNDPRLIGSRCGTCGIVTFPVQGSCPRCASTAMEEHLLPRRGRLWAWTTQEFPPPSPPYAGPTGDAFVPFGVGYVELGGEVKVEARLTQADALRIGMDMELVLVPFRTDGDGNEVVTFAFRPVG
jgi:uncharacterized OB-fold protein